jgi:hypothetical protein
VYDLTRSVVVVAVVVVVVVVAVIQTGGTVHAMLPTAPSASSLAVPPATAAVVVRKVRFVDDWPHVALHAPQLPHSPAQSTGHAATSQTRESVARLAYAHSSPPNDASCVTCE